MPKGPKGENRPADTNACAVMVAKIATGELEEDGYQTPGRVASGKAGAKARALKLSGNRRKEIASKAARARWARKEAPMNEKQRLLNTLFETQGREHLNLKFCRGSDDGISPEDICRETNSAILQAESGLVDPAGAFGDGDRKVVDVKEMLGS